ncbi:MAG: hypothetical protein PHH77_12595 [Victivallaceae bacterium]|nr:hypothetical protein [Victivallaceae bacterium]
MIRMRGRSRFDARKVRKKAETGTFRSLNHAAAAIRLTARRSIRRSPKESTAGTPPHTRRGLLKRSLLYNVDKAKMTAVIGPAYSIAGRSGSAHEFGGKYYGRKYPKREYMGPALRTNERRLPKLWADSIK